MELTQAAYDKFSVFQAKVEHSVWRVPMCLFVRAISLGLQRNGI